MTNDYIRREDAVDVFNRAVQDVGILDADDIETVFGMLSPADVALVVHGRWTLVGWHKGLKVAECSCCKKRAIGTNDFCPNCGAKMNAQG